MGKVNKKLPTEKRGFGFWLAGYGPFVHPWGALALCRKVFDPEPETVFFYDIIGIISGACQGKSLLATNN